MKKLFSALAMLITPFLPNAVVSNKRRDEAPTQGHTDSQEMNEANNIIDEAIEIAAAARRIDEETVYASYGMKRPNSENRFVITMNNDGTYDASAERDPNGAEFKPITDKDREEYKKLTRHAVETPVDMIREKSVTYKLVSGTKNVKKS